MAIESVTAIAPRPRADVQASGAPKADVNLPGRGGNADEPELTSTKPVDQQIKDFVQSLNGVAERLNRQIQFSVDEDSGQTVIKIVDSENDTVIRQYPPDELLRLAQHIQDAQGLILHTEA